MKKIFFLASLLMGMAPLAAQAQAQSKYYCEANKYGYVLFGPDGAMGFYGPGAQFLCNYYALVGNVVN